MRTASRSSSAAAFALAAAFASGARAEAPAAPQPHGPHLKAAIRLYQKLDLDAAMAELRLAEEEARASEDETVTVLIYEGLIDAENGRGAETADHFKRALAMRPWAEVPERTAPRLARQFSDVRRELWGSGGIKPPPKKRRSASAAPATPPEAPSSAPSATPAAPAQGAAPSAAPAPTAAPMQAPASGREAPK